MTSKNTTNETYPLIMCPLMKCRWDFEIDAVTGCQTCRDPCSGVVCPENETCVPIIVQCFVAPCLPMGFCEKITSSSII
ncbi:hypothetical protein ALC60_07012 [Trachymyrmex zeteki]|uniref:Uncharacterized protein n=2 Tax=Mycetomoellerius zeteki TaxID=64791 RepID=A0A151X176_9HYME|nr:hypothetical protein ALC60_07012 [Trachymyrmex zeteki]